MAAQHKYASGHHAMAVVIQILHDSGRVTNLEQLRVWVTVHEDMPVVPGELQRDRDQGSCKFQDLVHHCPWPLVTFPCRNFKNTCNESSGLCWLCENAGRLVVPQVWPLSCSYVLRIKLHTIENFTEHFIAPSSKCSSLLMNNCRQCL